MKSFTSDSIKNMIFDAGVVYANVVRADFDLFIAGTGDFATAFPDAKKLGATFGGNTLAITQEYRQLEVDGKFGFVKGMTILDYSDAMLTVKLKELNAKNILRALNNGGGSEVIDQYEKITLAECLQDTDYIDNVVLIAERYCNGITPEYVFVLIENVININGLELSLEDSNEPVVELQFQSHKTTNQKAAQVQIYTLVPAN